MMISISVYLIIILLIAIFIFLIVFWKRPNRLSGVKAFVRVSKNYFYLFFIVPALGYFIFYSIYTFNGELQTSLIAYSKGIEYFQKIAILILSASIFSGAIKYLQFLGVFKNDFEKIIMSDSFKKLLSDKIESLAYSEDHLIKQNNLEKIWKLVTLCKYKKYFPEISEKTEKRMGENPFFKDGSLAYYYKNFQMNYDIEIADGKNVIITENHSYTVVAPNKECVEFDFHSTFTKGAENNTEMEFEIKNLASIVFVDTDILITPENAKDGDIITKKVTKRLKGLREYHIESKIVHKQNLDLDRVFSFSSDRIIDDLTVNLKKCDNTEIIFHPLNGNKLHSTNTGFKDYDTYINRDIFLPGEVFIMFFYKNGKK